MCQLNSNNWVQTLPLFTMLNIWKFKVTFRDNVLSIKFIIVFRQAASAAELPYPLFLVVVLPVIAYWESQKSPWLQIILDRFLVKKKKKNPAVVPETKQTCGVH